MTVSVLIPFVFGLLFLFLILGAHLGLAMSAVAILGITMIIGVDGALSLAGLTVYESAQNFDLSVIPLFVLMGTFVLKSGISSDLFSAFSLWLHRRRGGLAHASIASCAAFGSVCGSSIATAAIMGQVALPEMRRHGYGAKLATGTIAAGGTIGILIPPSVIMLIYGVLTETSIGDLFLAGIVPGLLLTVFFMMTVDVVARLHTSAVPDVTDAAKITNDTSALSKVWPILLLFFIIIGGIYWGLFTPTEAGGFGAAGALTIGVLMQRLNVRKIGESLIETVQTTSMIFLILIGAVLFTGFISLSGTSELVGSWVSDLNLSPVTTIMLIVVVYIVLGAFLDTMAMIMLSVPVFFPIVTDMGYDPVWFGVLVVLMVELALITPPLGMNVFIIKGLSADVPLTHVFLGVFPFCIALLTLIILLVAIPELVTFLPYLGD